MTAYSLQYHLELKQKVQAILELLLAAMDEHGGPPGEQFLLSATIAEGRVAELTGSFDNVEFGQNLPRLRWHNDRQQPEYFNILYDLPSRVVRDSAQFSRKGEYQGSGHIQCWHEHYGDERDEFIDSLLQMLTSLKGTWQKLSPVHGIFPEV